MTRLDSHVDRADIDDLILGEGLYGGGVVARHAAITAGLTSVPGPANRHLRRRTAAVQGAAASGPGWTGW